MANRVSRQEGASGAAEAAAVTRLSDAPPQSGEYEAAVRADWSCGIAF
jgi:hypothetical protein